MTASTCLKETQYAQGTFKKYVRSRSPRFDPRSPLVCPCSFSSTLSPQGTFVLAGTHLLPLNFYTCEIQRKEINDYQYVWLNSTCLFRGHSGISINWKPLVHGKSVRFIESPSKNQKSSKGNMKSTICHDFPSPDLLEGPKDGKIKENAKFFFILKSSNKIHYISTLNY